MYWETQVQTVPLGRRLRLGALAGLLGAALLAGWATVGRLTMGAAAYSKGNGPWLPSVLLFFGVLPPVGVLVGLLLPLYRFAWGAVLLGFIVLFPLIFAF